MTGPGEVCGLVSRTPLMLTNEKSVQADLSALFDGNGIRHKREVRLGEGDVIDFMLDGGVGVEVKLKAPKRSIYRQCRRYCGYPQVKALVLVTATSMGFPPEVEGKPCYVASLGSGWLL